MTGTEAPGGVGWTALGVAAARALESARADRLFDDPYAASFVGDPAAFRDADGQSRAVFDRLGDYLALRTRFFDTWLRDVCAAGCRQVVLVASGLDTRAFRLSWPPGTRLFEMDTVEVLAYKDSLLAAPPACERSAIGVDLRTDWSPELTRRGFRPDEPTAWLVEGLLVYLTEAENDLLLSRIGALSAPGSALAVEYVTRTRLVTDEVRDALAATEDGFVHRLSTLWRNTASESPARWLDAHGWHATGHRLEDLAASCARPMPPAFDPAHLDSSTVDLLLADRKDAP
ncbi:SAM-dependent methyltransferase [Amycolatopsis minnesotensis]|uniref:S-adenosyl-L-methionine-dependent methyltransferase n=1 Tax=Amycolatopsis minnesotensis TaxID=337894 RepID=A0ABN2QSR3_9PSEU